MLHTRSQIQVIVPSAHCCHSPNLILSLNGIFFALAVSLNKLLLLKFNLKPFLKDTGIPKTLVLTQTCYDKIQHSKILCFGEKSMVRKNKIIAEVNLKHLV